MAQSRQPINYLVFKKAKAGAKEQLNNIFVVTSIAKNAVEDARQILNNDLRARLRFPVPTVQRDRVVVARNRTEILSLLEQTASRDLYAQALVLAVAVTEGYLMDMLSLILRAFPKKLGVRVADENERADNKVDLSTILHATCLEDVIEEVISSKIQSAFYAPPTKYFKYMEKILSISLPADRTATYAEVKATRDIYAHNGGIVNTKYLRKAGQFARAKEGELINIDESYFSDSIASMKGIINSVYQGLDKKYKASEKLAAYLTSFDVQ
jgi:hypothetical protein